MTDLKFEIDRYIDKGDLTYYMHITDNLAIACNKLVLNSNMGNNSREAKLPPAGSQQHNFSVSETGWGQGMNNIIPKKAVKNSLFSFPFKPKNVNTPTTSVYDTEIKSRAITKAVTSSSSLSLVELWKKSQSPSVCHGWVCG